MAGSLRFFYSEMLLLLLANIQCEEFSVGPRSPKSVSFLDMGKTNALSCLRQRGVDLAAVSKNRMFVAAFT